MNKTRIGKGYTRTLADFYMDNLSGTYVGDTDVYLTLDDLLLIKPFYIWRELP